MTTATPQNSDMIGWVRDNNRASRAARAKYIAFAKSAKRQSESSKLNV